MRVLACQSPLVTILLRIVRHIAARPKGVLVKPFNVLVSLLLLFPVAGVYLV